MDANEKRTEKTIEELEKRITEVYTQAEKEVQEKLDKHLAKFAEKDEKKQAQLKAGEITKAEYKSWRQGQIATGERWANLRDEMAKDLTRADVLAMSMSKGVLPEVFADSHNFGTFQIESKGVNTSYTLYDKDTVMRLIRDDPKLLPDRNVDIPKDLRWNKQHISNAVTQGILQGESIPQISKRLERVVGMDKNSAMRNARTMVTSAQNAGRLESMKRAEEMGIPILKQWLSAHDKRVRASHQHLDGQEVPVKEEFSNGLMYPADPDGDPEEVYNCRCTIISDVDVENLDSAVTSDEYTDMNYEEWEDAVDGIKTPTLMEMVEADAHKLSGVTLNALEYYAENGTLPSNMSAYQKRKVKDIINQYEQGVYGREVQMQPTSPPVEKLPTVQYKQPTESRFDADRWVKNMHITKQYTLSQRQAMDLYMMDSDNINYALRTKTAYDDTTTIPALSRSMSKYTSDECVYRGVDGRTLNIRANDTINDIRTKIVGKSFVDNGFLSTSRSKDVAQEFSKRGAFDEYEAEVPCIMVLDINGTKVSYLHSGLAEVLVDKGSTITFTDVEDENGTIILFGKVKQ